jgi:hypothetical protein
VKSSAVIWSTRSFFSIHDKAMAWLLCHAKELGRIGRWLLRLSPFKFKVSHVSGKSNGVADCLTRQYEELSADDTLRGLSCSTYPRRFGRFANTKVKSRSAKIYVGR